MIQGNGERGQLVSDYPEKKIEPDSENVPQPPDEPTVQAADAGDEDVEIGPSDILFNCFSCGKSLVIDYRGAGLVTRCTECGASITVPIPEGMELSDLDRTPEEQEIQIMHLRRTLNQAADKVHRLESIISGLRQRQQTLERAKTDYLHRFAEIRSAGEAIQNLQQEMSAATSRIMGSLSKD